LPNVDGHYPTIGVGPPSTTTLGEDLPALPGTAAAAARPALEGGDEIVQVGDAPVDNYAELRRQLALHPDKPLTITVLRRPPGARPAQDGEQGGGDAQDDVGKRVATEIAPQPMRRLGLVMEMGPVTAVQEGSPAEKAGIQAGDVLLTIDGHKPGDPMTLPQRLRGLAGQSVKLVLSRKGGELTREVTLRNADWFTEAYTPGSPVGVPSLGIAYSVLNRVAGVVPGSPAAEKSIGAGEVVAGAKLIPPDEEAIRTAGIEKEAALLDQGTVTIEFDDEQLNWPHMLAQLQARLPGTHVELTLRDEQDDQRTVTLEPADAEGWFYPLRGLLPETETFTRKAGSLRQAADWGYDETVDSLLLIYRTLEKLGSGQVSAKELVGPVGIIQLASRSAAQGTGELLIFLTILSANLAVLNFLPIPVLDGGHMVFLAYEGVRGKPPSENVFLALSYLGLIFILGLMIWVIGLDIGRLLGL
jgi:regulator of sigma E protease